jgi:hypothetical protein
VVRHSDDAFGLQISPDRQQAGSYRAFPDLTYTYKTMSYLMFDESSPAVFDAALSRSKLGRQLRLSACGYL